MRPARVPPRVSPDPPALRRLQTDWKAKGHTLRELIHLIATCELMRRP